MKKLIAIALSLMLAMSLLAGCAQSGGEDAYPSKPISWIVPVAAGTGTDLVTRQVVDQLDLGVTISVENVVGGAQTIGTNDALSRGADGYTLLSIANAGLISQPLLNPDIGYSLDDLEIIAMLTPDCMPTITVSNDSEIKSVEDWINFVTTTEEFSYGIPSSGGYGHLTMLYVFEQLGVKGGKAIQYDGNNGSYQALLNGEVSFCIADDNFIFPYVEQGACNTLVCVSNVSSAYLPTVPNMSDRGWDGLDALAGWKILCVHADTPDDVVEYLKEKVFEVLNSETFAEFLVNGGYGSWPEGTAPSSEDTLARVKQAYTLYDQILTSAGLK
ncbi:MAG: tripartite tricarboxylate transporter substrate binding protein [Lachnospiraceae bacterium]|nr:tripartite tricarboxylate transporter substrate binding protein [Lachnospiraceae bacterium]